MEILKIWKAKRSGSYVAQCACCWTADSPCWCEAAARPAIALCSPGSHVSCSYSWDHCVGLLQRMSTWARCVCLAPWCNFWARCVYSMMKFLRPSVFSARWRALASSGCQVLVRCQLVRVGLEPAPNLPCLSTYGHGAQNQVCCRQPYRACLTSSHICISHVYTHIPLPTLPTGLAFVGTLIDALCRIWYWEWSLKIILLKKIKWVLGMCISWRVLSFCCIISHENPLLILNSCFKKYPPWQYQMSLF